MIGYFLGPSTGQMPKHCSNVVPLNTFELGKSYIVVGPLKIDKNGFHVYETIRAAIRSAFGSKLFKIKLEGEMRAPTDELGPWLGRKCTVLETHDFAKTIRRFARDCALQVRHFWDMPSIVEDYFSNCIINLYEYVRMCEWIREEYLCAYDNKTPGREAVLAVLDAAHPDILHRAFNVAENVVRAYRYAGLADNGGEEAIRRFQDMYLCSLIDINW